MFQIALKSLRSKWRDYTVLFVGLIIAVAVFYMLSAIATNKLFLEGNSTIAVIVPLFTVGEFLLGVITFVYLNFANNFLLRLRQTEYGLMSMLGATRGQIGGLLLMETLLLGSVATIIGIVIGTILTVISSHYLISLLGITINHWPLFSVNAAGTTLVFFLVVFLLNGAFNQRRLMKQDTLTLLNANKSVNQPKRRPVLDALLGLAGLGLLVLSYWLMPNIINLGFMGVIFALIVNVLGTYWFISRTLKMVTYALRRSTLTMRGLRSFLNGQLLFRLPDYQRLLAVVSVMFGLALGAMSVGQGYYQALPKMATTSSAYTIAVTNPKSDTAKLTDITWKVNYTYAVQGDTVYFAKDELNAHPVPTVVFTGVNQAKREVKWLTGDYLSDSPSSGYTLQGLAGQIVNKEFDANYHLVDTAADLWAIGTQRTAHLIRVKNMAANQAELNTLAKAETAYTGTPVAKLAGSYGYFGLLKNAFGGLEFMGMFLGVAFLAMLASTLMFKVLSGVQDDKRRYRVLNMIGTSERKITMTVAQDLGNLFFIPLIIGLLDVVFGLQMFKSLMTNPYEGFAISTTAILALYVIYYLLTVFIYRRLIRR